MSTPALNIDAWGLLTYSDIGHFANRHSIALPIQKLLSTTHMKPSKKNDTCVSEKSSGGNIFRLLGPKIKKKDGDEQRCITTIFLISIKYLSMTEDKFR
jgi:hypothetical protein